MLSCGRGCQKGCTMRWEDFCVLHNVSRCEWCDRSREITPAIPTNARLDQATQRRKRICEPTTFSANKHDIPQGISSNPTIYKKNPNIREWWQCVSGYGYPQQSSGDISKVFRTIRCNRHLHTRVVRTGRLDPLKNKMMKIRPHSFGGEDLVVAGTPQH